MTNWKCQGSKRDKNAGQAGLAPRLWCDAAVSGSPIRKPLTRVRRCAKLVQKLKCITWWTHWQS